MITHLLEQFCKDLPVPMFFLRHGQAFEQYMARPEWVARGITKNCYGNSVEAVRDNPERLVYCEGMALPEGSAMPLEHAWVISHEEIVIDPTWHDLWPDRKVEYWGIPLKWRFVVDTLDRTHSHGIVGNWTEDFPLLSGKVPIEEYLWRPAAPAPRRQPR